MPRQNVYLSEKDKRVILNTFTYYKQMWEAADESELAKVQGDYAEIERVEKKLRSMNSR